LSCSPTQLAEWNALNPSARLVSGMVLQAFLPAKHATPGVTLLDNRKVQLVIAGSEEFLDLHEERKGRRRLTYTVRPGDTLRRIARRFGISVGSLLRINQFGRSTRLKPGDTVVVYTEKKARRRRRRRSRTTARSARRDSRSGALAQRD
jgi:LysM repeat protein